jgi:hypothetical protein
MKAYYKYIIMALAVVLFNACKQEFIDPVSKVDPGTDETAPIITVTSPKEGAEIKSENDIDTITVAFVVTDDIEIGTITVSVDGAQVATFNEFLDYRRYVGEVEYIVEPGDHVLSVLATDLEGKSTTREVNFFKSSAYSTYEPLYPSETLYIPFDGDYRDYDSGTNATVVGTPGFAGESILGDDAYAGAEDSYLTFPSDEIESDEFSAVMWIKPNAVPDRAGILVVGPEDTENPGAENLRTSGFRLFREGSATEQRFKLNVGTGDGESWNDGGVVDPSLGEWVHLAFTISATQSSIYINGELQLQTDLANPISWADCNEMSIMSGAPHFNGWDHLSDLSYLDELRTFNTALTQTEIQTIIANESGMEIPTTKFDGEIFYMPFDGDYTEKDGNKTVTAIGTPGFAGEGKVGNDAYMGATDSYLQLSSDGIMPAELSATMWMKVNADPESAGILVMGPEDADNPGAENIRTSGFRFFREGNATEQRFKLNVGTGDGEAWNDGGTIDPSADEWVFLAFTIASDKCVIYINGELTLEADMENPISWDNCNDLSIMSGEPHFSGWEHFSDLSFMDDLRLYDKALTQEEVQAVMNAN